MTPAERRARKQIRQRAFLVSPGIDEHGTYFPALAVAIATRRLRTRDAEPIARITGYTQAYVLTILNLLTRLRRERPAPSRRVPGKAA